MIYSKTCEYAIRALAYLTTKKEKDFCMIPDISSGTGVPKSYLAKIFQSLVKNNILTSRQGPGGGFSFKRNPDKVTLFEIVQAVDHTSPLASDCIMGLDQCSAVNACPLHFVWTKAKEEILNTLRKTTLRQMRKKTTRLHFKELNRSRLLMTAGPQKAA